MSGVRQVEERVKGVFCHKVQDPAYISMLAQYGRLLFSAYGPKSNSILICNDAGRETLVASSSEIVKQLSFSHPTVKYINALMSAQNAACGLNGLYTGILCTKLLEGALCVEEEVPHPVVRDVSEWIISELLDLLAKSPDDVVVDLDISDMDQVISFVRTILQAKNCLNLSKPTVDDLSINIVKAFLKSIPNEYCSDSFGHVTIATQEESSSIDSRVFDGVLFRDSDISPKQIDKIGALDIINIVLFNIPLLYVEGENEIVNYRGRETKEEKFINTVLSCLVPCMKQQNVHILANQKSVHPVIKFELEREGFLVMERMGSRITEAVIRVSGSKPITNLSNLHQELGVATLGKLTNVEHVIYNGKSYILLDHIEGCASTLLLPVASPSILSTLKDTVESCMAALRMVVIDGKIVGGGGCMEMWAASRVQLLVSTNMHHLCDLTGAAPHHIVKVASIFIRAFTELALGSGGGSSTTRFDWCLDSVFHHLWHAPPSVTREDYVGETSSMPPQFTGQQCICGMVKEEVVKQKGCWHTAEFYLNQDFTEGTPNNVNPSKKKKARKSPRLNDGHSVKLHVVSTFSSDSSLSDCAFHNLNLDADSLEASEDTTEEEVDSLEKQISSQKEEVDSLEGILDSIDVEEDVDSLEDMLDNIATPHHIKSNDQYKAKLEAQVKGALYDSFPAKFNALRLSLEGFTHLFHIGQCVFDK